ncbi:hypothetical protein HFP15_11755 [Amycolatopsis sp. K13G38]|uniref:Uncharacterized protein n=1 Tax=Amycolatopsis acididurans TaxID=2724524 RepID=A0ABX1J5F6_9PSEU|nr:hypothetical protein [Amycolatopsis acididurans]NKQ53555.1 hypothetical protein [Amycolatopsis acididurans]
MTGKDKKSKDELAAARCGMTIEQWQRIKAQTCAARARGKRPAGTAGAETKLAGWGDVDGQEALFTDEQPRGGER